jgi:hypothetical protein
VVDQVASDEGPPVDRVALLVEFRVSRWGQLCTSSLKLHCVDKLTTSIIPSVDPFGYTRLIKRRLLFDPHPLPILGVSTAIKHTATCRWWGYRPTTIPSQLRLRLILQQLFREQERILTQAPLVESVVSERLLVSRVVINQVYYVLVVGCVLVRGQLTG